MTNPFQDITDPAELLEMARDGVECEACERGKVIQYEHHALSSWNQLMNCLTCHGIGHTPLSNADLDALAACWCEGEWVEPVPAMDEWCMLIGERNIPSFLATWAPVPAYTTDPVAAMRLQVKCDIGTVHLDSPGGGGSWEAGAWMWPNDLAKTERIDAYVEHTKDSTEADKLKALCRAITEAALLAALTDAMP